MEDLKFKEFVFESREKAQEVIQSSHISDDVKSMVQDMDQIIVSLQSKILSNSGQSGDMRLLKNRFDQLKSESAANTRELDRIKTKTVPAIAVQLKEITNNLGTLKKALDKCKDSLENDNSLKSVTNIHDCLKKIIDVIK